MKTAISVLAGYINPFLLFAYVLQAFWTEWKGKKSNIRKMAVEMYVIHFLCYITLYFRSGESKFLTFYALQLVLFFIVRVLYAHFYPNLSMVLFQNMLLLLAIGFVVLSRLDFSLAIKQFVMASVTIVLTLYIPAFIRGKHRLERYSLWYALFGIGVLLFVFLVANERLGAKIWLNIGGITIQPSEFVKISFIFGMAGLLLRKKRDSLLHISWITLLAVVHVLLLVASKDLGSALLFFILYLVLLFVTVRKKWYTMVGIVAGVIASVCAYCMFDHVKVRILAWKNPFAVVDNEGYQIAQSLFAIGTGGLFGTGLLEGNPNQIPVVTSDFIFSAICEELGCFFALGILLVYVSCLQILIRFARKLKEDYYRLVFLGFVTLFSVQIFLNVGGIIKMIPSTGVTLPFISYGGSSLCSMILMFQLIQGMQERTCLGQEKEKPYKGNFVAGVLKEYGQKRMRYSSIASVCLLGSICLYFLVFLFTSARTVIYHSYNRRQEMLEKQNIRGSIYAGDGTILAETLLMEQEDGTTEEIRVYPYGEAFAHMVGQTVVGTSGIEAFQEITLLTASIGEQEKFFYRIKGEKAPANHLHTTLQPNLQTVAYEALKNQKGAVCVLEPQTGKILACVSTPTYNPNELEMTWENFQEEELFHRALYGLYAPGSTFKLATALAYIQAKGTEDFLYDCKGTEWINGVEVNCYQKQAHGTVDLKTAVAKSCNTAFAVMGNEIGKEAFTNTIQSLFLTEPAFGELPYAEGMFSLEGTETEQVQTAFGQGTIQVTPYYMACFTATIANKGQFVKPFFTDYVTNAQGKVVLQSSDFETETRQCMTEQEASFLTEYMKEACQNTALQPFCEQFDMDIAGKTGTAEYSQEGEIHNHAWFICFAPIENPQIAMSVVVEDAGLGNEFAVPIAEKILNEWLQSISE